MSQALTDSPLDQSISDFISANESFSEAPGVGESRRERLLSMSKTPRGPTLLWDMKELFLELHQDPRKKMFLAEWGRLFMAWKKLEHIFGEAHIRTMPSDWTPEKQEQLDRLHSITITTTPEFVEDDTNDWLRIEGFSIRCPSVLDDAINVVNLYLQDGSELCPRDIVLTQAIEALEMLPEDSSIETGQEGQSIPNWLSMEVRYTVDASSGYEIRFPLDNEGIKAHLTLKKDPRYRTGWEWAWERPSSTR